MKKLSDDHKAFLDFLKHLWQERPDIPYGPKSMYQLLLTYENLKRNDAWICQDTMVRLLGTTKPTLRSWTILLDQKDLIRVEKQYRKGKPYFRYTLFAPQTKPKSDPSSTSANGNVVPFPSQNCTNLTPLMTPKAGSSG